MTNLDEASAEQVGHLLDDFGINLLVSNVARTVEFLENVFKFDCQRKSEDYAIVCFRQRMYQLHADHTYSSHPLLSVLPELGLRGAGVELRLYEVDPDEAEQKALTGGFTVLQGSADKPHGLRECFILDPDGYCWVPSVRIFNSQSDE